MGYLKDSCVFIKHINTGNKILEVSAHCKRNNKRLVISDEILTELYPGAQVEKEQERESAKELYKSVDFAVNTNLIEMIRLKDSPEIMSNYRTIRNRFYGWMKDHSYLKKLIKDGLITKEEIQSKGFKYKDVGECSLIAIAMVEHNLTIVTNDKGKVYKHPEQNLFDTYAKDNDISVLSYKEWVQATAFGH